MTFATSEHVIVKLKEAIGLDSEEYDEIKKGDQEQKDATDAFGLPLSAPNKVKKPVKAKCFWLLLKLSGQRIKLPPSQ